MQILAEVDLIIEQNELKSQSANNDVEEKEKHFHNED